MNATRGNGFVYKRGKTFWMKYYHDGKPVRRSCKTADEPQAKKMLRTRIAEIRLGRMAGPDADKITLKDLAADLKIDYRNNGKKSLPDLEYRVRHLLSFFGESRKAHDIRGDHISKYMTARLDAGASNATINRELAALKRMFNLAIKVDKIFRKPQFDRLSEAHNVRKGFFEHADLLALRKALPLDLQPLLTFAYYTGWRRGEIVSLKWSQVDLHHGTIRLDPGTTKNGDGRTIFLDGEVLEVIKRQAEKRKVVKLPGQSPVFLCPYVFHRGGKPIKDFRDAWERGCKKVGLTGKLFHDLRRTGVRNLVRRGVPDRVAMSISGHKTRAIFDRYNIVSMKDLEDAARRAWVEPEQERKVETSSGTGSE